MAKLTTANFKDQFQRAVDLYKNAALRQGDPATAAIREEYGALYLDFFPLDTLRGLKCDDARKNEILDQLLKDFLKNDGDFAYAILGASRDMLHEGAQFAPDYRAKLELVVADMWRKMGAMAERKNRSAEILLDEKCTQSAEAINALGLNETRILELAKNPEKLHRAASVLFPELSIAMEKMAAANGEAPRTAIGERIRKGLLLPQTAESVTRL